jgi:DNA-binding response OmpR family regulator
MRILTIEDDFDTANYIRERLEEKCFAVDVAETGEQGLKLAQTSDYDIILLDYALPKKNGFTVCQELRNHKDPTRRAIPIIMISVTNEVAYKVDALNLGIDDYVTKPFFFDELYARIQAILRRPQNLTTNRFELDDLKLDTTSQRVTRGKTSVYLTKKEFALLEYLIRNKGTVMSRGAITEHVWDMSIDPISNTIEMHILNLRKKLDLPRKKKLIHSVPGRGYKLDLEK